MAQLDPPELRPDVPPLDPLLEWLLTQSASQEPSQSGKQKREKHQGKPYGDLVPLNTHRVIADSIDADVLTDIVDDYLDLLQTSAAVYEKNGDYALGIFSSGWCRFMDDSSRKRCGTPDHRKALQGGEWHCHEACWKTSRQAIETGATADLECLGGIRIHAVPIRVKGEVVGSINFGYGDPPRDLAGLEVLAARYGVSAEELRQRAEAYESRPPYIIELAKKRLQTSAKLIGTMIERKQAEEALGRAAEEIRALNAELEQRVAGRTADLQAANKELAATNKELEAFTYTVSHDLRVPVRAMLGFTRILREEHGTQLSAEAQRYLQRVTENARTMGNLVDDLLSFTRVGRQILHQQTVAPGNIARQVWDELAVARAGRAIELSLGELPPCQADRVLLKQVFFNLLANAIKFTRGRGPAQIEVGCREEDGERAYFVRDNGAGFDMQYADKLFGVFQRLHRATEFEGTGVGLAIVQRIVSRHSGRIWAEAAVGQDATFYFSIGTAAKETPR